MLGQQWMLLSGFRLLGKWKQGREKISNIFKEGVIYFELCKYVKKHTTAPELHSSNESIANILRLVTHSSLPWSRWPYNPCSIFMTEVIGELVWALTIPQHHAILHILHKCVSGWWILRMRPKHLEAKLNSPALTHSACWLFWVLLWWSSA